MHACNPAGNDLPTPGRMRSQSNTSLQVMYLEAGARCFRPVMLFLTVAAALGGFAGLGAAVQHSRYN